MHDYSIDRHPKEKILFFLAFAAIATAPYINKLFAIAAEELKIGLGWVTVPGAGDSDIYSFYCGLLDIQ
jgi:hypothetical protein